MQARKINDVFGLTETKINRHLYDLFEIVEELMPVMCAGRRVRQAFSTVGTDHKHRFVRKLDNPKRKSAIEKMWHNPSSKISVAYAHRSSYEEEEQKEIHIDLKKLFTETTLPSRTCISRQRLAKERREKELHNRTHELEWNAQGRRISELIMSTHIIHGDLHSQKPFICDGHASHLVDSSIMK
uniref:E2F_TDP domain-containing protein n=1 Tax=Haemonchus contortus TaxID=6289 RepID=A0A7I4XVP1_HAECO